MPGIIRIFADRDRGSLDESSPMLINNRKNKAYRKRDEPTSKLL